MRRVCRFFRHRRRFFRAARETRLPNLPRARRELELAKVSVRKEDIDLIASELEIGRDVAERTLRIHNGEIIAALRVLVSS